MKTIDLDECREQMNKQNAERIFTTNICAIAMESTGGGKCHKLYTTTYVKFH